MKNSSGIILLIVVAQALGGSASSFTPPLNKAKRRSGTASSTALAGWLDFKPVHGGGNDDKANDEMFEAQQEMLRARRGNLDKDELKKKFSKKKADDVQRMKKPEKEDTTGKQDAAEYVEGSKFKFPWQK
jgi:hypothetical protein